MYPSSYRPTLILILPGATGVATGHFEGKTIVVYSPSEAVMRASSYACDIDSAVRPDEVIE